MEGGGRRRLHRAQADSLFTDISILRTGDASLPQSVVPFTGPGILGWFGAHLRTKHLQR